MRHNFKPKTRSQWLATQPPRRVPAAPQRKHANKYGDLRRVNRTQENERRRNRDIRRELEWVFERMSGPNEVYTHRDGPAICISTPRGPGCDWVKDAYLKANEEATSEMHRL